MLDAAVAIDSSVKRAMQVLPSASDGNAPPFIKWPCLVGDRHEHCRCYNCGQYGHIASACLSQMCCNDLRQPQVMTLINLMQGAALTLSMVSNLTVLT